jgi:hypothetical protein
MWATVPPTLELGASTREGQPALVEAPQLPRAKPVMNGSWNHSVQLVSQQLAEASEQAGMQRAVRSHSLRCADLNRLQ